jgi:hypothetical protein
MVYFDTGSGNSEVQPSIAEASILAGCFLQRITQSNVVCGLGRVPGGSPTETDQLAGCPFAETILYKDLHCVPFLRRPYHFFDATSFRPSTSSACFETIRCRRAFTASSCLSFTTSDTASPAKCLSSALRSNARYRTSGISRSHSRARPLPSEFLLFSLQNTVPALWLHSPWLNYFTTPNGLVFGEQVTLLFPNR